MHFFLMDLLGRKVSFFMRTHTPTKKKGQKKLIPDMSGHAAQSAHVKQNQIPLGRT